MLCYRASGACELLYDYGHWSHYPVSPVLARIHWAVHPYPPGLHPLRTPLCEVSGSPWQLRTRPNVLCCLRLPHCTTGSKCGSPSQVVAIPGSLHCAQPFFLHDLGGGDFIDHEWTLVVLDVSGIRMHSYHPWQCQRARF